MRRALTNLDNTIIWGGPCARSWCHGVGEWERRHVMADTHTPGAGGRHNEKPSKATSPSGGSQRDEDKSSQADRDMASQVDTIEPAESEPHTDVDRSPDRTGRSAR